MSRFVWKPGDLVFAPGTVSPQKGIGDLIRDQLETLLAEELPAFDEVRFGADAKWALASGLQKAIRRRRTMTALTMAAGLLQVDPRYAQRRLPVIAAEDVGHSNPLAVAMTLFALDPSGRGWRRGRDLGRVMKALVHALCQGGQDRSACDAAVSAAWHPAHQADRAHMATWTADRLQAVMADSDQPVVRRATAAAYLGGQAGGELAPRAPDHDALLEALDGMGISSLDRWITEVGLKMQLSGMAAQWGWTAIEAAKVEPRVEPDDLLELPDAGPYPSATFDQHVGEGQRALSYFLAACKPVRRFLLDGGVAPEQLRECLGSVVFEAEGGQLAARLQAPVCLELHAASVQSTCGWFGLNDEQVARAIALVRINGPMLSHARRRILGLAPRGSSPPVVSLDDLDGDE